MGQDEGWRRRTAELILWYYESHRRKNDCPIRELVAVMMIVFLFSPRKCVMEKDKVFPRRNDMYDMANCFAFKENLHEK